MLDADAIREHLRGSLSKYKLPVEITIMDDLPKNAVGKIAKPELRKRLTGGERSDGEFVETH
jgi:acyl-CoA synthetase (AMP-forming)/AMP-acid ligase II